MKNKLFIRQWILVHIAIISMAEASYSERFYFGCEYVPSWIFYHNKTDKEALGRYKSSITFKNFNAFAGYNFTSRFGLESGAIFVSSKNKTNGRTIYDWVYTWEMDYVDVPLFLTFSPFHKWNKNIVRFCIGPMFCFLTGATGTLDGVPLEYECKQFGYTLKDKYHPLTIDAAAKFDFNYNISGPFFFRCGISYQHGFTDIENKEYRDNQGHKVWNYAVIDKPYEKDGIRATTIRSGVGIFVGLQFAF